MTRRTLDALAAQIPEGRAFPGALLLTGPSESLLAPEAAALAAALLCPGSDPDHRCESCRRVFEGIHPDFLLVAPEGVQIRVDRVRDAIAFAAGRPYESARRVAVVPRAELLGAEAGNALLKSLEEPGSLFHWILTTTRPEMILPTIRSRCAVARVDPPSPAERLVAWQALGFRGEDASDLALLSRETEEPPDADGLAGFREFREQALAALEVGLSRGAIAPLLQLAETLSKAEPRRAQMLSELLADAAASGAVSPELARHPPVAGVVARLARGLPREALARAALRASDPPPDTRRGNRRLHFESVLLELYLARRGRSPSAGDR